MKNKYLFIILIVSTIFTACSKDNLFLKPATSLSDETVLETKETVKTVLMGAYSWTGHYYYLTISQLALDVMGNDITISDGTYGFSTYNWIMYAYNYNQYPKVVDGWWSAYSPYMWQKAYQAIDQCNLLINNADKLPPGSEDVVAQAYGLRGYNFLKLYYLFCPSFQGAGADGQGLFLKLEPGSSDRNDVPRSKLGASLQQIVDDFTYAYKNATQTDPYFMNKKSAALLLARTYMELGKYPEARQLVETLSSFGGQDLMTKEQYQSGFNTINSEWLWGFNFTSETSNIYASIPSFYYAAVSRDKESVFGTMEYGSQTTYNYLENNAVNWMTGYSTVRITKSFKDLFGNNDARALFPFYINNKDGYFTSKFTSKGSLGIADYPICRISEAYLIEAEILAREGSSQGLNVLNALQSRRGGTLSTSLSVDEVWKERRRELYGEGFALPDIKRLQKPLERVGPEQWSAVKNLPANSPRMMFPIPQDELDYNKNSTPADQNEYWR